MLPLDMLVATTLADALRQYAPVHGSGAIFEKHIYQAVLNAYPWHFAMGPDQVNMGLPISSRTGTQYEFDGIFEADGSLYLIEAKQFTRSGVKRQHVGIFIQKILDILLGSYDDIGHLTIKPILASAAARVDRSAWRHAVAWGVLLLTPDRVTPFAITYALQKQAANHSNHRALQQECEALARDLWRPFTKILSAPSSSSLDFRLNAAQVFDAQRITQVLDHWADCEMMAASQLGSTYNS